MKCFNCGKEIPDDARFCKYCGKEQIAVEKKTRDDKAKDGNADDAESGFNKESDSIKDADKWTKIIYYFLYVVCSLAFVLIVGSSIYYIVSPESQEEPETNASAVDSIDVEEMIEDSLPQDEPVKVSPPKNRVVIDTIPETQDESESAEPAEPEITEPYGTEPSEPANEENNTEDLN